MRTKLLYILIVLLALAHLWLVQPAIQYPIHFQVPDSLEYLDLARTWLSTGQYASSEYPGIDLLRSPGYPLFILVPLWLQQGWPVLIAPLQVVLLFITAWILYRTSADLGYRQMGLAAVIIFLLNPNAAFWSMVTLSETLAGFCLVLGIWCFVRYWKSAKRWWLLLAGVALGYGALTRPIFLPLAIGLWITFFLLEWRQNHTIARSLKASLVLLVGILVMVISWHIRNQAAYGHFTLSEVGGSTFQNWYIAKTLATAEGMSRDEAVAMITSSPDPLRYSLQVIRQYPGVFVKEYVRGSLRTLLGAEYETWARLWGNTGTTTTGLLTTLMELGNPSEMISALSAQAGNMWFQAGLFALLYDGILFVAVLIGFWKVLRKYRQELLFNLAILILFSLIYLLFIPGPAGESRFRVPADPLLALAGGMAFLPRYWRTDDQARGEPDPAEVE